MRVIKVANCGTCPYVTYVKSYEERITLGLAVQTQVLKKYTCQRSRGKRLHEYPKIPEWCLLAPVDPRNSAL